MAISKYLQRNFFFLVLSVSQNALQYIAQILMGRFMVPADFGTFNALNGLGTALGTSGNVISYMTSSAYLQHEKNQQAKNEILSFLVFFCFV